MPRRYSGPGAHRQAELQLVSPLVTRSKVRVTDQRLLLA